MWGRVEVLWGKDQRSQSPAGSERVGICSDVCLADTEGEGGCLIIGDIAPPSLSGWGGGTRGQSWGLFWRGDSRRRRAPFLSRGFLSQQS